MTHLGDLMALRDENVLINWAIRSIDEGEAPHEALSRLAIIQASTIRTMQSQIDEDQRKLSIARALADAAETGHRLSQALNDWWRCEGIEP